MNRSQWLVMIADVLLSYYRGCVVTAFMKGDSFRFSFFIKTQFLLQMLNINLKEKRVNGSEA